MKNQFILGSLLVMFSCKPSLYDTSAEGKYSDSFNYHELILRNNKTFIYVLNNGCCADVYKDTCQGSWSLIDNNYIMLSFCCKSESDPLTTFYAPYKGKDVQIKLIDKETILMDSLSRNIVLTKVQ